jgi:glucose-6-phosphate 1-dehydrogenase
VAERDARLGPTVVVIFGAGGDLTWRKLVPAVYNLHLDGWLHEQTAVIGVDLKRMTDEDLRSHWREGIDNFSRQGKTRDDQWKKFAANLSYLSGDATKPEIYAELGRRLEALDHAWAAKAARVFYLATSPTLVQPIVAQLGKASLASERGRTRLVVEKPFGRDLASAKELNRALLAVFEEPQIFRIDHYLGKETVQNILAFRFANSVVEPLWNRRYIDHVQITVGEEVGVEHRGGYYDQSGALRDMVQNHLMQVLCMVAMEPPQSFSADEIRNKKADVLRAIRPISPHQIDRFVVRAQYAAGMVGGKHVKDYRGEDGVAKDSRTETFVAARFCVDNWRWQDVPFYLRTGKSLAKRTSQVVVQFRPVPHQSFPPSAMASIQPNQLIIHVQPDEGIRLVVVAKVPGPQVKLAPVDLRFAYQEAFRSAPSPEAYETLLLDVIENDGTLFMRADQAEMAWGIVAPIQEAWAAAPASASLPTYPAGTWGPPESEALIAADGRQWLVFETSSR